MLKNSTPKQIALLVAGFITCISGLVLWGILLIIQPNMSLWWLWLLYLVALFNIAYGVTVFYLKNYIYRKIKLVYKTIRQQKISSSEKSNIDINHNMLDEVEKEVSEWAATQEAEIRKYKSWAEYRRRYVGDISHELKTPIFNIQGFLHTLLDGGLEDDQINVKYLKKAAKNVDRLYTIVEDLTAISRLESGDLILEMQEFSLRTLVADVLEDLEYKAAEHDTILEFKYGADAEFMVVADRESIRQVIVNLVDNSIKYGKEGGVTKIGFYDMDKYVLIEIADDGIGIPQEHLPHVFDRFYRVDKSRSRIRGGSGLGLSIVKHIVEAHKQTINVRSTQGMGSTFGFTLEKVVK